MYVFNWAPSLFLMQCETGKNYERCAAFLGESAKQPLSPFNNFCNEVASDPRVGGLNLSDYLIMPVQRMPRYKMLLADLLTKCVCFVSERKQHW